MPTDDGFVISSLHARTGTRIYAKAVAAGPARGGPLGRGDRGAPPGHGDAVTRARPQPVASAPAGVTGEVSRASTMLRPWPSTFRSAARRRSMTRSARGASRGRSTDPGLGRDPSLDPTDVACDASRRPSAALLGGLNPEQLRAVTHGEGPLLVVAGAGTGKTQVITRRIAWLIATRRARPSEILALTFTDKAAEEMQVRVDQLVPYGYTDTRDRDVPRVRRPPHPRVRAGARAARPTSGSCPGRRSSSSCASTCSSSSSTNTGRSATRRASSARWRRCSAAARTRTSSPAATSPTPSGRRGGGRGGRRPRETGRRPRREEAAAAGRGGPRQLELARAYARYQELLARTASSTSATRWRSPCASCASRRRRGRRSRRRFRYILVDEFQDTNRAQSELVGAARGAAPQHHGRRRRRPVDLPVPGRRDQQHPRVPRALPARPDGRPATELPVAAADPRRRHRLIRFNDPDRLEVRAGIAKRLRAERADDEPAPVRLEAFATGARRRTGSPPRSAGRIAAGARPRDHAVLVRANGRGRPDPAQPQHRPASRGGSPARRGCTPGRRSGCCWRSCGPSRTSLERRRLRARGVASLRARRRGPDRDRQRRARRRNRTRLGGPRGAGAAAGHPPPRPRRPATAAARASSTDLRALRASSPTSGRPARSCTRSCADRAAGPASGRGAAVAAEEALQNIARFFEIVRSQSALLADDRAIVRRAPSPDADRGRRRSGRRAELDPDADAVAVLTVHKAKGLEFPVVFLPGPRRGPVPDRRTARAARRCRPSSSARRSPTTATRSSRRSAGCSTSAMTRARDELVLTHAADYGGARARRVSPFVLEALDLPRGGQRHGPAQVAAIGRIDWRRSRRRRRPAEPLPGRPTTSRSP